MNTKEFLKKLEGNCKANDFTMLDKMRDSGKDPEAVYAIAKDAGVTDSFEVFREEAQAYYEAMDGELTEEELSTIAGGEVGALEIGCGSAAVGVVVGSGIALAFA